MKHNQILRRGLSILLSLVLCLSLLPATALAAEGDVAINEETFPDATFRVYVSENFDTDDVKGTLSAEEIANVTSIDCSKKAITDLTGIEFFTALTTLNCSKNQLKALNVTSNTALTYLDCSGNQLTSLNLSRSRQGSL